MGRIFLFAMGAIAPIILLIIVGYLLKTYDIFSESFFRTANKFVFNIALPALLFYNVYSIDNMGEIDWITVIFAIGISLLLFGLGFVAALFIKDRKQKGVIWQCFFRSNFAIIGLPLAQALGGKETLAVVSVLSAFCVATFNVLAVIALSAYSDEASEKASFTGLMKRVIANPLVIAIICGIFAVFIRGLLPTDAMGRPCFTVKDDLTFIYSALEMISRIATPFALIVLGGLFSFGVIKNLKKQIIIGTLARMVVAPAIGLSLAVLLKNVLGFGSPEIAAFIALLCPPVAVSSSIMAAQMNNDEQLAGQLVVWTSILSVFTLFIAVVLLKSAGLI